MKGAIDDIDHVIQTLKECGFTENQFYIHCDGALSGLMLPFLRQVNTTLNVKYFVFNYFIFHHFMLINGINVS